MSKPVKSPEEKVRPKRRYDSARRRAQAGETRQRILEAAQRLFPAGGYAGTTIDGVAKDAGVAVETVYAVFGSKRALLASLVGRLVGGEESPVPLLQQSGPQAIREERDQRRQIRAFSADISRVVERVAPIFEVIRSAAATEPEMASLIQDMQSNRLENLTRFAGWVAASGPLRDGIDVAAAAETVWALASPEVYRLLTGDKGWTRERYAQWLGNSLVALLLPDAPT